MSNQLNFFLDRVTVIADKVGNSCYIYCVLWKALLLLPLTFC